MKKLTKIKWENIAMVGMIALDIMCILHHIELNGFYNELSLEIVIYGVSTIGVRYLIKDIRTNPENWLFEK